MPFCTPQLRDAALLASATRARALPSDVVTVTHGHAWGTPPWALAELCHCIRPITTPPRPNHKLKRGVSCFPDDGRLHIAQPRLSQLKPAHRRLPARSSWAVPEILLHVAVPLRCGVQCKYRCMSTPRVEKVCTQAYVQAASFIVDICMFLAVANRRETLDLKRMRAMCRGLLCSGSVSGRAARCWRGWC